MKIGIYYIYNVLYSMPSILWFFGYSAHNRIHFDGIPDVTKDGPQCHSDYKL